MATVQQQTLNTPWDPLSTPNEFNPPPEECSMKWSFPINVRPDQMKFVIGRNGSVFKSITENVRGGLYIWFNKDAGKHGKIEIWGTHIHALKKMRYKVKQRMVLIQQNNP